MTDAERDELRRLGERLRAVFAAERMIAALDHAALATVHGEKQQLVGETSAAPAPRRRKIPSCARCFKRCASKPTPRRCSRTTRAPPSIRCSAANCWSMTAARIAR